MPIGRLKTLVHLSQQRHLQGTRLIPDHNDKGYGFIEDAEGHEVFFSHDVVKNRFGFDALRQGQMLEYTLENGPYLRASSVRIDAQAAPSGARADQMQAQPKCNDGASSTRSREEHVSTVRDRIGKQADELMHDLQELREAAANPPGDEVDQNTETEFDYCEQAPDEELYGAHDR